MVWRKLDNGVRIGLKTSCVECGGRKKMWAPDENERAANTELAKVLIDNEPFDVGKAND